MAKINIEDRKSIYQFLVLTETELQQLDLVLSRVEKDITFPKPSKIRFIDWEKWIIANGGKNEKGEIILDLHEYTNKHGETHKHYEYPCVYETLINKQEQYLKWKGNKEFVERKKIEGLEEIAEKMSIKQEE